MPDPYIKNALTDVIIADLQKMQDNDSFVEGKMKTNKTGAIICGIVTVSGFFLTQATGNIGIAILFTGLAGLIIFWIMYAIWAGKDIENRRFLIPMRLFSVLNADIKAHHSCGVTIDFSGYKKHGRLLSKNVERSFMVYPVTHIRYIDNWFGASGKLTDGCRFKLKIVQDIRRTEKAKRKYTKVKEKISEETTVYLRPDPAVYPNFANIQQHLPADFPGEITVNVTTKGGLIKLSATTGDYIKVTGRQNSELNKDALFSGDDLLRLFVYLYTGLQHCR